MGKISIRRKIQRAFAILGIVSFGASALIAALGMLGLRSAVADGNSAIGGKAALAGGEVLVDQALLDAANWVSAEARGMERELRNVADTLELLAGYLSYVYQNADRFPLLPFHHVRFVPDRGRQMQWMLSPGMVARSTGLTSDLAEAGVVEETFLVGNMRPLFDRAMAANQNIASIYIASLSGINVFFDDSAAQKTTGDVSTDVLEVRTAATMWYYAVARNLELSVTDAYRDRFGRGLCITFSAPYFGAGGEFKGVMGIDFMISDLSTNILQYDSDGIGYAVLLNVYGVGGPTIIAAPGVDDTNKGDICLFLGRDWESVILKMKGYASGVAESTLAAYGGEQDVYVVWAPVELTGWTFAFVLRREDVIAPSELIRGLIEGMTRDVIGATDGRIVLTMAALALFMLAVLVLTAFVAANMSKRITDPIMVLAGDVKAIGDGNLDYTSNIRTGDEVEDLSLSFQQMTVNLKNHVNNLSRITAEKERIGAELNVATKIQASMLPCIFPAFPERAEFDVYATMIPAKEVGGDFYDFFMVDENRLAIVIADVSDKGVPAALFMVIAKTLIKNNAQSGKPPREVFETVNDILCESNSADMFVTAFMGVFDISTGLLVYVNAGHNPPLVRCAGSNCEWLRGKPGFVLAGIEGTKYRQDEITLGKGDSLFLYTDGVTEAMNRRNKLFTEARLLKVASDHGNLPPREFVDCVKSEIDVFADGAEQADDITMAVLKMMENAL